MNRSVWIRRAAAAATLALAAVCAVSAAAIGADLAAVTAAAAGDGSVSTPREPRHEMDVATLRPMLRSGKAEPGPAVGEFLNGRLGELGLHIVSADVASLRPLGGGLKLAEVRIQGRGDLAAAGAVANWVAVNRQAVRLKSMDVNSGADGESLTSIVLLMVIA